MAEEETKYARYFVNRGYTTLWKGDAAEKGAEFVEIIIFSNEWNSTHGTFQVCALEGVSRGIQNDQKPLADKAKTKVLFDGDVQGMDAAEAKAKELIDQARARGFENLSQIDVMEFEQKQREVKE